MNFESLYEGPSVLAKQLEVRWFHNPVLLDQKTKYSGVEVTPHLMPFLRRSLTYINRQKRLFLRKNKTSYRNRSKSKDLLWRVFRHKTIRYNKALLPSPIATRKDDQDVQNINHYNSKSPKSPSCKRKLDVTPPNAYTDDNENNIRKRKHTKKNSNGGVNALVESEKRASAFGKTFPRYSPMDENTGVSNPPRKPKEAFTLFCDVQHEKARKELSPGAERRNEELVKEKLKETWDNTDESNKLYWKQEEAWDQQRYLHEKYIYDLSLSKDLNGTESFKFSVLKAVNWSVSAAVAINSLPQQVNSGRSALSLSKQSNKSRTQPLEKEKTRKVFFHFFYFDDQKNELKVQIEKRNDRRCPFCYFNAITDEGLLIHCNTNHNEELSFEGGKDSEENLHIGVKGISSRYLLSFYEAPDHLRNFIFVREKKSKNDYRSYSKVPFIKIPYHRTSSLDQISRRKIIKNLEVSGNSNLIPEYTTSNPVPFRQYYHSRTNLPMRENEWDYDSDDQPDDNWIHRISEEMIDEFDDVSREEKIFMKLWNEFIKSHTTIADKHIPQKCLSFITKYNANLITNGLRQNLLLHLFNLWDHCVISSDHINDLMEAYDFHESSVNN